MKHKVGDRVRIKSLDWYNENKSKSHGTVACGSKYFDYDMREWCGKIMTILDAYQTCYIMKEDGAKDLWTDEMIEGLVEEETALNKWTGLKVELELSKSVIGVSNVESLRGERFMSGFVKAIIPPEGYQFVDENGNIINATKIVLEKKKKEYPKTYEKCCYVLGFENTELVFEDDYRDINPPKEQWKRLGLMNQLNKLLICRDAYWKIAGEEMGLGKPWELSIGTPIYYIYYNRTVGTIKNDYADDIQGNIILAFPTKEMRDAFYENFKELIETVKELL